MTCLLINFQSLLKSGIFVGLARAKRRVGFGKVVCSRRTGRLICRLMDERFAADPGLGQRFPASPPARGQAAESLITFVTDRPGHDRCYAINAGKITAELGYQPRETLETGIRRTVEWYLANEPWWRGVMDGSYRQWLETQYGK